MLHEAVKKLPYKRRVFSGIQPTGIPHLGNLLGALRPWVAVQDSQHASQEEHIFCVADLHALTNLPTKEQIKEWRPSTMAALLAVGLDPTRSTIFFQSSVLPSLCRSEQV